MRLIGFGGICGQTLVTVGVAVYCLNDMYCEFLFWTRIASFINIGIRTVMYLVLQPFARQSHCVFYCLF